MSVIVKTQKQLDAAIKAGKSNIVIDSAASARLTVRENSHVVARENSRVDAWDNSRVIARGNSYVEGRGNSRIYATQNSRVYTFENSLVNSFGIKDCEGGMSRFFVKVMLTVAVVLTAWVFLLGLYQAMEHELEQRSNVCNADFCAGSQQALVWMERKEGGE